MTKPELLALMRLLSALESWAMAQQARLPDYLSGAIATAVQAVERDILGDSND